MKDLYFNTAEDISSSIFIKLLIESKKSEQINASIRALAKRGDFSPSSLSRILSGEQRCSIEFADRLFKALKLSPGDLSYLKKIILYETSTTEVVKKRLLSTLLTAPLNFSTSKSLSKESLQKTFKNLRMHKIINYYNHENLEQRSLHLFKDSEGGAATSFFDSLLSIKNSVSSISFFIESEKTSYFDTYLDTFDDNQNGAFNVSHSNKEIKIEFSDKGLPHIKSVTTHFIHETKFGVLDFEFTDSELLISGDVFDSLDSNYSQFYERIYVRV